MKLPEGFEIPKYDDMTREELLETVLAMESHHQEHHDREYATLAEDVMEAVEYWIDQPTVLTKVGCNHVKALIRAAQSANNVEVVTELTYMQMKDKLMRLSSYDSRDSAEFNAMKESIIITLLEWMRSNKNGLRIVQEKEE